MLIFTVCPQDLPRLPFVDVVVLEDFIDFFDLFMGSNTDRISISFNQ